jgi:hypothetical protein
MKSIEVIGVYLPARLDQPIERVHAAPLTVEQIERELGIGRIARHGGFD